MSFAKNIWAGLQVVLIEHYIQFSLSTLTTYNSGLEKTNGGVDLKTTKHRRAVILNLGSNNPLIGVTSDHQKTGIYMRVMTVAKLQL